MSYNNPQFNESTRPNIGFDGVVTSLRDAFDGIPWLSGYVFGRAYENRFVNTEGQDEIVPVIYQGNGEYYDARPNDNLPATIFFRANGDEEPGYDRSKGSRSAIASREMSLIFWGDLTRINPSYKSDSIYIESIKEEFLKQLTKASYVKSIVGVVDEPIERVFSGYTMVANLFDRDPGSNAYNRSPRNDRKQYGKFPFAGLRVDFEVSYRLSC